MWVPAFAGGDRVESFFGMVRFICMEAGGRVCDFSLCSRDIFTGVRAGMQVKPDQDAREHAGSVQAGCHVTGLG